MDYASSLLGLLPGGRRTPGLKELLAAVGDYLPAEQVERIREAAEFGASAHKGQKRLSGEPYIAHPVAAAAILADLHLDADTIIAAILHDVIEDTPTPKDQLAARFGADVAEIVDGVTKLDQIKFKSREEAQAERFRKMLLAMVRDLRVILVKLADRTHNMRTIEAMAPARRRAIARETLEIYAPIAERLGLYNMKLELEDLGFKALYPQRYRVLERALQAHARQPEGVPEEDRAAAERGAAEERHRRARRDAREASLQHLQQDAAQARHRSTKSSTSTACASSSTAADTCYRALGAVHCVFKPMPGRFKDYIAIPRVNGYQSLHTTLFGPNGVPIEVQIRTEDMHRVAQSGIAAHWKYKTGGAADSTQQERAREWLSQLVALQEGGQLRRVPRERQGRPVPRQGLRVHAQGADPAPAQRRDRGRLRLRGAHRRRQPLRRGQDRPAPDAAAHGAAQRPDGGDHHRQGRDAQSLVGEFRGHRQGAQRHPPLPEEPAAHRGDRARRERLLDQALGEFALSLEDVSEECACRRRSASSA